MSDRDNMIFEMRKNGHTFSEIANLFKISTERARQIYVRERSRLNPENDDSYTTKLSKDGFDVAWLYSFSTRVRNCFLRGDIKNANDLYCGIKNNSIRGLRNMGRGNWSEVLGKMQWDDIKLLNAPRKITQIRNIGKHQYEANVYEWVEYIGGKDE